MIRKSLGKKDYSFNLNYCCHRLLLKEIKSCGRPTCHEDGLEIYCSLFSFTFPSCFSIFLHLSSFSSFSPSSFIFPHGHLPEYGQFRMMTSSTDPPFFRSFSFIFFSSSFSFPPFSVHFPSFLIY